MRYELPRDIGINEFKKQIKLDNPHNGIEKSRTWQWVLTCSDTVYEKLLSPCHEIIVKKAESYCQKIRERRGY